MPKIIKPEPTIVEVRKFIFEQMEALRDGKISIHEGIAQAKMAHPVSRRK